MKIFQEMHLDINIHKNIQWYKISTNYKFQVNLYKNIHLNEVGRHVWSFYNKIHRGIQNWTWERDEINVIDTVGGVVTVFRIFLHTYPSTSQLFSYRVSVRPCSIFVVFQHDHYYRSTHGNHGGTIIFLYTT